MTLLRSIFQFKCPNCREGSLFVNSNPYKLRELNKMHERCSKCNLKFSLEPGFYQGAAYVSYALQVLNSLIIFNLLFWFTTIHLNKWTHHVVNSSFSFKYQPFFSMQPYGISFKFIC